MLKSAIYAFLSLATSLTFFIFTTTPPPKSHYHSLFLSTSFSDNASISLNLYTLTRHPHVAGTQANADTARYVLTTLTTSSIKAHLVSYDVALTYPASRSLTLDHHDHRQYVFDLRQKTYGGESPYADEVLPSFHGYGKSGNVSGRVTYANYGRVEDYMRLKEMGVNVSGSIVLAKYGEIYRGDIVNNAYAEGAVGTIIYSDRKDFGGGTSGKWFPDSKWLPPTGVQVGSVYSDAGDPTTPGWPSTQGCERIDYDQVEKSGVVPMITSLPVSGVDGEVIIKSIGGEVADDDWQGSEDAPLYRVGPGPGVLHLNFTVNLQANNTIATIHNVIGVIEGAEEPDRFVLLGNHRDAWTFGAVDPNSGTAALLEIAQRLGKLQKKGWKPRRTIIFCSWDAEEYGLIGSPEWVEDNRQVLTSKAVAYLNVDIAVRDDGFYASATPQLDQLLKEAAKQVEDPKNSSRSIYDSWTGSSDSPKIGRLGGGGSDYAAFVQHIGVASADMSYGKGYPVYHSMYDDFGWMSNFGDPMFHKHVAVASIWGYLALRLADDEILPFNYIPYAEELKKSAKELEYMVSSKITVIPLLKSVDTLTKAATIMNNEIKAMRETSTQKKDFATVREINDRLMMAERAFTDPEGLPGRKWYKHLIYGPAKHNEYGSQSFPGVDDTIEQAKSLNTMESWQLVQHEVWRVARAINQVAKVLSGELT
ncbi:Probable glutamate carboxypeptidase LAMP1 [Linum grandiflorum]